MLEYDFISLEDKKKIMKKQLQILGLVLLIGFLGAFEGAWQIALVKLYEVNSSGGVSVVTSLKTNTNYRIELNNTYKTNASTQAFIGNIGIGFEPFTLTSTQINSLSILFY